MMIIPINRDVNKTQYVIQEYRNNGNQCSKALAMRCFHFQYHDGDNDGDNAVTECFQAIFPMGSPDKKTSIRFE
jgi:hypothetical protein